MYNSQKQSLKSSKTDSKSVPTSAGKEAQKSSSKGEFSTKSAPDNSGKTGSHKSKSS
jgi:hypothetical protein